MTQDTQPAPDDAVPDRFVVDFAGLELLGTYRVDRKLADGGMGSVYLGEDTNLGRPVVVKVPHVRFLGEAGFRARFTREIKELVRLEHPHVVRIMAQGEHESVPFFVLQYLGGKSLEERLEEHGPYEAAVALPWFRRVAEALDFVHERNTIHRDVKPANILFDETSNVYLSDFGVAKALDHEDANLTEAGTGLGSPRYMAPEQGYGRELDGSADQYALAASLYETLSGKPPHGEGTPVELLVRKASEDPEPLASVAPEVPEGVSDAVARAMSREPAERFDSCHDFMRAVERGFGIGTGEVMAPQPTPAPAAPRWIPWMVAAVVLLGAGLFFLFGTGDDAPPVPTGPPPQFEQAVRVLSTGAEPRKVLRYRFPPATAPFHIRLAQDTTMLVPGMEKPSTVHTGLDMAMDLTPRASNGIVTIDWKVVSAKVAANMNVAMEAQRARIMRGTVGTTGAVHMDASGARIRPPPEDLGPEEQARRQALLQFLNDMQIALPTEPIGVGARWEVAESVEIVGIRFMQTATFTLERIDGDVLHLSGTASQAAPTQEMVVPGMNVNQRLTSMKGTTVERAEIRLDSVSPVRRHQTVKIDMELDALDQAGKKVGDVRVGVAVEIWTAGTVEGTR